MSTAIAERPSAAAKSNAVTLCEGLLRSMVGARRILIDDVLWEEYEAILEYRDAERRAAHLYYDRGRLEVVTKSIVHERYAAAFEHLVLCLADAFDLPLVDCRETTVRREDVDAGFEPDVWFYVGANATRMASAASINFQNDPPPDLAIEIEISRSLTDRLPLYARLGVVEIWRFDGTRFEASRLASSGIYESVATSLFFPRVRIHDLESLGLLAGKIDTVSLIRHYRQWIKANFPTA